MKTSLNNKLFILLALLVFIVIFIIALLNTTALQNFYIYTKREDLSTLYSEINKIYNKYDYTIEQSAINQELEKIDSKKNIDIVIQNGREITIYSTSKDFSQNKYLFSKPDISMYLNNDYLEKLLYKSDDIQVIQIAEMEFYSELLKFNKSKRFIKNKL